MMVPRQHGRLEPTIQFTCPGQEANLPPPQTFKHVNGSIQSSLVKCVQVTLTLTKRKQITLEDHCQQH